MEEHVPADFLKVAKCFALDCFEDEKSLAVICTTSGQILEFSQKQILDSFDLDEDADEITIFTSYNPVQKFYLVKCKERLFVVKRTKPMCVVKSFENVSHIEVYDKLCIGRPQVVITTLDDKEPIVTDFVGQLHFSPPQLVPPLTTSLNSKLQEMNLRLEKARQLLQEKRTSRINAIYQLTPHLKPSEDKTQVLKAEPKVLAWGPPFPTQEEVPQPPLKLSKPWRRALNGKWIIGIPVFNTQSMPVGDLKLRLLSDSEAGLKYQTQVVVFPQTVSRGAEWLELRQHKALFLRQPDVPGRTPAVVLGVMEELPFKKTSVITFSGSMLYIYCETPDKVFQEVLDPVEFKVEDLIQGHLKPFSSSQTSDESDLLGVVATSSHWSLRVSTRHGLPAKLQLSESGLTLMPSLGCWVGRADGSLAGLLIIHQEISSSQHELELYAKDVKQALQFVHSLSSQWRVEKVGDSPVSESDCVRTLGEELRFLLTTMQPGAEFTAEEWAQVRSRLNKLELATDSAFVQYSPPKKV